MRRSSTNYAVKMKQTQHNSRASKAKIKQLPMDQEIQTIIPSEKFSRCPRLYGLLKIHKANIPTINNNCKRLGISFAKIYKRT